MSEDDDADADILERKMYLSIVLYHLNLEMS